MTAGPGNRAALLLGRVIVVLLVVLAAGGLLSWFTMSAKRQRQLAL